LQNFASGSAESVKQQVQDTDYNEMKAAILRAINSKEEALDILNNLREQQAKIAGAIGSENLTELMKIVANAAYSSGFTGLKQTV
jgi:hypothetical protein